MTMTSTRSWIAATLTAAALGFGGASTALAQDKPKDEGLEKLLEKLGEPVKDKDQPAAEKPKDGDKDKDKDKAPAPSPDQPKAEKAAPVDKPKLPGGEVAPKDKEIDDLLGQLGQTKDMPSPDDKKQGGGGGGDSDDPMPPKSDKPQPEDLKDGEKNIDDRLIDITGKQRPKKNQKKRDASEENGPLGQVIKEMRDVEQRLGEPDTGEATRKKQTEIVKNLDQLIEQMKNAPSQATMLKMIREGKNPGNQPGQPNGNQPGAQANGAQPTKPLDPKKPPAASGLDKQIWGELPKQLRDLMGNADSEKPLPAKMELIRQYYLSLGNKSKKEGD
jgi:hypothetical protein